MYAVLDLNPIQQYCPRLQGKPVRLSKYSTVGPVFLVKYLSLGIGVFYVPWLRKSPGGQLWNVKYA